MVRWMVYACAWHAAIFPDSSTDSSYSLLLCEGEREREMSKDSKGNNVIVCDNGTGVSVRASAGEARSTRQRRRR